MNSIRRSDAEQVDSIRQACSGDHPRKLNMLIDQLELTNDQRASAEKTATEVGAEAQADLASPHILIGTSEQDHGDTHRPP